MHPASNRCHATDIPEDAQKTGHTRDAGTPHLTTNLALTIEVHLLLVGTGVIVAIGGRGGNSLGIDRHDAHARFDEFAEPAVGQSWLCIRSVSAMAVVHWLGVLRIFAVTSRVSA